MGGEGGRKEKEIISGGIPELLWGGRREKKKEK
jgi:hypothetical protein